MFKLIRDLEMCCLVSLHLEDEGDDDEHVSMFCVCDAIAGSLGKFGTASCRIFNCKVHFTCKELLLTPVKGELFLTTFAKKKPTELNLLPLFTFSFSPCCSSCLVEVKVAQKHLLDSNGFGGG